MDDTWDGKWFKLGTKRQCIYASEFKHFYLKHLISFPPLSECCSDNVVLVFSGRRIRNCSSTTTSSSYRLCFLPES